MRAPAIAAAILLFGCSIVGVPPTSITGTVRASDGRPIENATVYLWMNHWAPLCCEFQGILQLTRTGSEGRYRFVASADRGFKSVIENRNYFVGALAQGFRHENAYPANGDLSEPLDITLEPRKAPEKDYTTHDCFSMCAGLGFLECRRVAEFHFGDKTRCDKWREDFW